MIFKGDCVVVMSQMGENSIDAVVTGPPYDINFMGASWDAVEDSFHFRWGTQALRVLKPGGHLVALGYPKTYHRMVSEFECAGFEIRDMLLRLYGGGAPKGYRRGDKSTTLRPACEPICLARKPLSESTAKANVVRWGTGMLNVNACRLKRGIGDRWEYGIDGDEPSSPTKNVYHPYKRQAYIPDSDGRWPTNLVFDEDAARFVDKRTKRLTTPRGGASRFGYVARATDKERTVGGVVDNVHITVQPLDLMRWLVRLVTPRGGVVLDPFLGSGTTAMACDIEGHYWVAVERDPIYVSIAMDRIEATRKVEWGEVTMMPIRFVNPRKRL